MDKTAEKHDANAIILDEPTDDGIQLVNGKPYRQDAKGALVPDEMVKPTAKLEDETVRKVISYARSLSDEIARFKGHTFADLLDFEAVLEQEYGLTKGGKKGNRSFTTFDGLMKVTVQVADFIEFGAELDIAKELIDHCLNEWSSDARPEIRAVVTQAFNTDKKGQINRAELLRLTRLDIEDKRWQEAVRAILDAIRIVGSKQYIRFYQRATIEDGFTAITLDLAKA